MAKLRHVAINCKDLYREAEYYKKAFELEEISRVGSAENGAVYLSDGVINVALIAMSDPEFPNYKPDGLNHIGFVVENLDEAIERAEANGAIALVDPNDRLANVTWEMKMRGPDGVTFDLSEHGWPGIAL